MSIANAKTMNGGRFIEIITRSNVSDEVYLAVRSTHRGRMSVAEPTVALTLQCEIVNLISDNGRVLIKLRRQGEKG